MSATLAKDGEIWMIRVSGMLRKADVDAIQMEGGQKSIPGAKSKILVVAEDFQGWHRGDVWGDVSFVAAHGDRIEKIAIVAEPQWEDQFLMFTGAGLRSTQINFFPAGQLAAARQWLSE